jgi:uncharacterized protein
MRDGIELNATAYFPATEEPSPCIFTLTPYLADNYHEHALYFAAQGFPFLLVDVRGRGNSGGTFNPFIQEAEDGCDVVKWLAAQTYCDQKVAMWGGSYAGYDQWTTATASQVPPQLKTVIPVASGYLGLDFPMFNNVALVYSAQWLALTSGRTLQSNLFADWKLWASLYRRWFASGDSFKSLDKAIGFPSCTFQLWAAYPEPDFWKGYNPKPEQYARVRIPVLTITGMYDGDQLGALRHYREHLQALPPGAEQQHFLVIGPWDHPGTLDPKMEFGGIKVGPASLVDLKQLQAEWYRWVMQAGTKPKFLTAPVVYYMFGADRWRQSESLDSITARFCKLYLHSDGRATDAFAGGSLRKVKSSSEADRLEHDPRDTSRAALEASIDPSSIVDQQLFLASTGHQLVYYSAPLEQETDLAGFFHLTAWIAINAKDIDFTVDVSEVTPDGTVLPLTSTLLRARYRQGPDKPQLIDTEEPLCYDFSMFRFVARRMSKHSRLRLIVAPALSIYLERNFCAGGTVAEESCKDGRPVKLRLYHNEDHPSALYLPIAQPESDPPAKAP